MMRTKQNNEIVEYKKSEVRSVMGRIIANKVKGMNWMAKISLILVFTLIFSTFMQQGLFNPKEASAAIADVSAGAGARVNGWYRVTGTTGPFTITNANFSCGAGTNRLLVVAVTGETGTAAVPNVTVVKPAGTNRTVAVQTTASTRTHAFIGYFTEAQIVSSGTNSIVVTNASGQAWTGSDVYLACFSGVDPTTPIVAGGTAQLGSDVTTTTSWPFSVTTASGSVVMYTGGLATAGTGVFTNPAGFTESYDITGTGYATTLASNAAPANPEAKSVTYATGNRYAFAAATLNPASTGNLTIGEGTNPSNANAPRSSTNNALDGFTMAMSAGSGAVSTLTVTGSANFNATNIPTNGVKVYRDLGTVGAYDAGTDVLVSSASSAIAGNATTVTISSEAVTTSAVNYLVTIDINAGATLTNTITANISAATGTGLGTPVDSDAASATLTVTAAQTLTVGNGTNPGNANALTGSTNSALDAFTFALNTGSGTVSSLTVTGSANFTATNIPTNGVKVYRDLGTVGVYDAGTDVLVSSASTAIAGNATTVTISSEAVTTSTVNYLVTVDIDPGATATQAFTGTVTAVAGSGLGTPTYSDSGSATLTIVTGPKTTITSCGDCHGNPPVDGATRDGATGRFPGSHNKHAGSGAGQYGYVCTNCHISPLWTSFNHRDGNVQFTTLFGGVAGGSYSRTNASNWFTHVNSVSPGTCSNTYCHSKGTGGTLNAGDPRTVAANTSPTWGSVVTCVSCHGNETGNPGNGAPWYTTNTTKANSHQAMAGSGSVCNNCHAATTSNGSTITSVGRHNNRTYDLVPGPGISFTYAYSTSGGTCSAISCHGNAKWGTGVMDCTTCHSAAMTKTLGGMGTIRQITGATGDFSRVSRHLFSAGFNSILKWDCIVCHMEGWPTGGAVGKTDAAFHNEGAGAAGGRVNVRNVDNWTTGWAINNRAWTTTDYANLDTFCLTCHDADGAAGINVNATNNGLNLAATRALTPFNTSNYPGGVVGGSTTSANAGPRTRVVNIKDKFYAGAFNTMLNWASFYNGNPSQHAVIGQRYSTVNANWTAAAWGSYVGKKMGQNLNVRRETSLLSCADCHVLDAGSGAHGGTARYNMWNSNVNLFCNRCHNSAVYMGGAGAAAGSRVLHSNLDGGRFDGDTSTTYGLPNTTEPCMLCHASWNEATTVTRNASYGGIHGSWSTTDSWYSTAAGRRTAYRFAPGVHMKMSPPSDTAWGSGGGMLTCYFTGTNENRNFDTCGQHDAVDIEPDINYNYGRPPKY